MNKARFGIVGGSLQAQVYHHLPRPELVTRVLAAIEESARGGQPVELG